MGWREQLRRAAFRGVPFEVESGALSGGRRVTVHEYPLRDTPFAEDMGRKAREFSLSAFVIGADYLAQRDALLAALETPGSGTLVHPYFGTLTVTLTSLHVSESAAEGGMAKFDLAFVETGTLVFPSTTAATGDGVKNASGALMGKLSGLFGQRYSLAALPDWARRLGATELASVIDTTRNAVAAAPSGSGWLSQFNETTAKAPTLTGDPAALGATLAAAMTKPAATTPTTTTGDTLQPVTRWATAGAVTLASPATSASADPVTAQTVRNSAALRDLMRGALLAQGADTLADTPVSAWQDGVAARKTMAAAMDAEMRAAPTDEAYQAWATLRAALYNDLSARAIKAARLRTVSPPQPTPALALAYDLYEDAGRDGEIVSRNAIRHPGFVPPQPLLVLSS